MTRRPLPGNPQSLLSKSAFKVGRECPRRLAYRREGYPSKEKDDPYLEFLADGGFMVEALARALYPKGREIRSHDGEAPAAAAHRQLLATNEVDLFEPLFEHDWCSARIDILSRRGSTIDLIEIKGKSFNSNDEGMRPFRGVRGGISAAWMPYLVDLAFQVHVVRGALGPSFTVVPRLCLVDTAKTCGDEAIFSKVELLPRSERAFGMPTARYLGDPDALAKDHFLAFVDASDEVNELLGDTSATGLAALQRTLSEAIAAQSLRQLPIARGVKCRDCEFRGAATAEDPRDGFKECWGAHADASPHILDLFRIDLLGGRGGEAVTELLDKGVSGIRDVPLGMIHEGSTTGVRQRVQVESVVSGMEWCSSGLKNALAELKAPFHFVDFETSRMAVPYHAGMHPYEQVAFQFSCHTLDGPHCDRLHHSEWINIEDRWPNVAFAEALRNVVGTSGQMLVWSDHERSALREIRDQIIKYKRGPTDLAEWIEPLTVSHDQGGRTVDLYDICRLHYYHPSMGGKTSIKAVLTAIWQSNDALHQHPWFRDYLHQDGGKVLAPYEALPEVDLGGGDTRAVRNGTGAMRAYQDMVYGLRRNDEIYRRACRDSLLAYCKLDTLAMVMVWVHWTQWMARENQHGLSGRDVSINRT